MGPTSSGNWDFSSNAPPNSLKPLFIVLSLWSNNYNFTPSFITVNLFIVLPLPRAQAFFYIGLPSELVILHLLPTSVVFRDLINNTMDVNIVKARNAAYFTDGWIEILEYYNIPNSAFIKLIYCGHGLFDIVSLQNLYFQEADYPVPPRKFEFNADTDG